MTFARHLLGMLSDLIRMPAHSGQWWVPVVVLGLVATAILVAVVKSTAPVAVYVLF
jgi:hypothetical protein